MIADMQSFMRSVEKQQRPSLDARLLVVWTQENRAVAARASIDLDPLVDRLQWEFDELMSRIGHRFVRVEPRRRVSAFVRGLLAGLPRANCWTLAEHAGDAGPQGMQRLLSAAAWDHDGVAADLRDYVVEHFADPGAVLVVDETGDLKKGTATVGVQRQYTGTAGRIENSQVAVYLAYTSRHGHALIDRALYLPRSWTGHGPITSNAASMPVSRTRSCACHNVRCAHWQRGVLASSGPRIP